MKYLLWPFLRVVALVLLAVVTVSGLLVGCRDQQRVLPLAREMALDSDEGFLRSHHLHVSGVVMKVVGEMGSFRDMLYYFGNMVLFGLPLPHPKSTDGATIHISCR